MAGGSGTRLWPASSSKLPKQFLPADEKMSFFSMALERAFSLGERVIIITGDSHIPHVIKDADKFTAAQRKRMLVIGEPAAKNTAAAVACAVVYSQHIAKNRNMLVLTSDHIIKPLDSFKSDAALAAGAASEDKLVVFGIPPVRPETGYGYIETEKKSYEKNENVLTVAAFHEKPDIKTAKKYTAAKRFYWNSGMFAFNTSFITKQFQLFAPDVYRCFEKQPVPGAKDYTVIKGVKILSRFKGLESAYKEAKSISFDYAIAEKCKNTAMVRVNFDWIDIGNWEEYIKLDRGKPSDKNDSVKTNKNADFQVFNIESETCYVDSDIPVALAGVDDLIIVIRSGKNGEGACALITKKGKAQMVRDIVDKIKKTGRSDLL